MDKADDDAAELVVHGIRHSGQRAFLQAYSATGNLSVSAQAAGVHRTLHYKWLNQERYAEAFEQAQEVANDALEAEARRRAVTGVEEPVFYKGEVVGTIRKYSDRLLTVLLAATRPEKFRTNTSVELSGNQVSPLEVKVSAADALVQELTRIAAAQASLNASVDESLPS